MRKPFNIEAVYANPALVPNPSIAKFQVTEVPVDPKGNPTVVEIKTRFMEMHATDMP